MEQIRDKGRRRICLVVFVCYIAVLLYMLFFSQAFGRTVPFEEWHYNLIPLREIRRYLVHVDSLGLLTTINIAGNVLAFVPFGLLVPVVFKSLNRGYKVIPLGAALSLTLELIQLVTRVGSCDIDDLILNTMGTAVGYGLYYLMHTFGGTGDDPDPAGE